MEFLAPAPSWLSLEATGLASRHFWYLSLQAASMVLHSWPADGWQWKTWHRNVFCQISNIKYQISEIIMCYCVMHYILVSWVVDGTR